jgi:hypothetical protein
MSRRSLSAIMASLGVLWVNAQFVSAAAPARRPTKVVVIATQHFITDMPDGYTPGHLRALLKKVRPDVVAVEACTNVDDPWTTAPYELAKVTRPWATENKVEIVPIGWNEPNYSVQIGAMFNKITGAGKATEYGQVEQKFQKNLSQQTMTCARMNDDRALELWRDYHAKLHELSGEDTPWEQWNAKIAANLLAVCRKHAGKRIAIVFGGAHAYCFLDRLTAEPGVRVIDTEDYFPLTESEVRAATKDFDHLQAMRLLNYEPGSLAPMQLTHIEKLLERLNDVEQYQNDYQYFSARLLLHQQKADDALKILSKLSTLKPDVLLDFDGATSVRDASRLQTYFALIQQGKTDAALLTAREIAADGTVSLSIRQTARALLKANAPK